ncbi:MAG: hypothetical protein ACRELX_06030 [Longimicrobiales bacterium]
MSHAEGDIVFIDVVDGLSREAPPVTVVLVRSGGWRGALRALFRRGEPVVREVDATAERGHGPPDMPTHG